MAGFTPPERLIDTAASAAVFAPTWLGRPEVKLDDASLSEWVADPVLPVEAG
jgi:3-mercaptopyruvate sulfurtransferase SseA